ncbi:uncharacterized protein LOC126379707 [Pectinophora gossypiella]|uniref:uncharacterized protein LOC126379707 n=1 Tax=Pectinophora gossypiella TaxID=13191 RepID=UPI00214F3616|nr:uncharacterized protein LOC126379707 [Pectinophora gossypiella]
MRSDRRSYVQRHEHEDMKLSDVYSSKKKLGDLVKDEDEPKGDVVFVASKYHDVQEKPRSREDHDGRHEDASHSHRRSGGEGYVKLDLSLCKNSAAHTASKNNLNRYIPLQGPPVDGDKEEQAKMEETRRAMSGRRAISLSLTGINCGHPCPQRCTDDYVPECAESNTGEKRVFINHCVMDDNSCKLGLTWKIRPLVDCVGSKKADVQQNRAFIDWMLRIGILDKKGRLNLTE